MRQRQPRHLLRVLGLPAAALGQLQRRPPADVGDLVDLADVLAVALDEVEDQALAQRQIAQRDVLGVEAAEQRVEQHRAGHRPGRRASASIAGISSRCSSGRSQTILRTRRMALAGTRRLRTSAGAVARLHRRRHRAERQDRARGADDPVVAGVDDVRPGSDRPAPRCARASCARRGRLSGSEVTKRSVRRMTPSLKLRAKRT